MLILPLKYKIFSLAAYEGLKRRVAQATLPYTDSKVTLAGEANYFVT